MTSVYYSARSLQPPKQSTPRQEGAVSEEAVVSLIADALKVAVKDTLLSRQYVRSVRIAKADSLKVGTVSLATWAQSCRSSNQSVSMVYAKIRPSIENALATLLDLESCAVTVTLDLHHGRIDAYFASPVYAQTRQ